MGTNFGLQNSIVIKKIWCPGSEPNDDERLQGGEERLVSRRSREEHHQAHLHHQPLVDFVRLLWLLNTRSLDWLPLGRTWNSFFFPRTSRAAQGAEAEEEMATCCQSEDLREEIQVPESRRLCSRPGALFSPLEGRKKRFVILKPFWLPFRFLWHFETPFFCDSNFASFIAGVAGWIRGIQQAEIPWEGKEEKWTRFWNLDSRSSWVLSL